MFLNYPSYYDDISNKNENTAGWYFSDHPLKEDWDTLNENIANVVSLNENPEKIYKEGEERPEKIKDKYDDSMKDKVLAYVNLAGGMEIRYVGESKTFMEYLTDFYNKIPLPLVSYSYYPLYVESEGLRVDYDTFYSHLETVSKFCAAKNKIFWTYCQSQAYVNKWTETPFPMEEYMRFQIFSALGYGAQGIVYWTFCQRYNTESELYTIALVDQSGKRSPVWYSAKKINSEIRKYEHVFLGSKLMQCYHTGSVQYKDTQKIDFKDPNAEKLTPIKELTSGAAGVQLSILENNGKNYLVIVNHDIQNFQDILLHFYEEVNAVQLTPAFAENVPWGQAAYAHTLTPGGYIIFEYVDNRIIQS